MPTTYMGELFALLASFCFVIGPTLFTLAGRQVSLATVNRVRLVLALFLLMIPHWLTQGTPFPLNGSLENWFFMGLSGLFSLVIGDTLLFAAFRAIGTRLSMLVISLIPMFSALLAWALLDERLTLVQTLGIVITLAGIAWVLMDRRNGTEVEKDRRVYLRGFLLAFGSAFCHAIAAIAAKKGLAGDFPAVSAHMIRTLVSVGLLLIPMLALGQTRRTLQELRQNPQARKLLVWGSVFGPVLGMWLSLLALETIPIGVASSLISLPPIWLLPVGRYFFKERVGWRAVAGSLAAVAGVALMVLF